MACVLDRGTCRLITSATLAKCVGFMTGLLLASAPPTAHAQPTLRSFPERNAPAFQGASQSRAPRPFEPTSGNSAHGSRLPVFAGFRELPFLRKFMETNRARECRLLCSPDINIEPTWSFSNLLRQPLVEDVATGQLRRLPSETTFELVLSMGVPTTIPRVELTLETIFAPGEDDNEPEFEAELNLMLLTGEQTGGWLEAHFDIIDQFSPRERPGGSRAYTHKLNFELDVVLNPFNRLPSSMYLHHVSPEVSFDYLATCRSSVSMPFSLRTPARGRCPSWSPCPWRPSNVSFFAGTVEEGPRRDPPGSGATADP